MSDTVIMACDIGLKRIGIAILLEGIILPLSAIMRKNKHQAANELDTLLTQRGVQILIVGMPHLSGVQTSNEVGTIFEVGEFSTDEAIKRTQMRIWHFIKALHFRGEIYFVNEDYSSKQGFENLAHLKQKNRQNAQKDGRLDSLSACEILESFLHAQKP